MQPQLCSRCKKNVAVVFLTRMENGQNINEGLCLSCAKKAGLPQVDEVMRRMGLTDEDLDAISNEMLGAFGGAESLENIDDENLDEEEGKTATFPFLNRLFGGPAAASEQNSEGGEAPQRPQRGEKKNEKKVRPSENNLCTNNKAYFYLFISLE